MGPVTLLFPQKKKMKIFVNLREGNDFKPFVHIKLLPKCAVSVETVALCGLKATQRHLLNWCNGYLLSMPD